MTHRPVDIRRIEPTYRLNTAAEWVLVALLAFMPLALGVVDAWSETLVALGALAIAGCLALKQLTRRDATGVWSWSYVPVLLFVALAVFQLIRLPAGVVHALSPNTTEYKTRLLGDLPNASDVLKSLTLSFYPAATRHDLIVVLFAGVVFVATIDVFRRSEQIRRLLVVIAGVGGAVGLLALLQYLTTADKIYWVIPTPWGRAHGSFVNYSHFAQFMNLSIGAALGLLLVRLREAGSVKDDSAADFVRRLNSPTMRRSWWLGAVIVVGMITIVLSMSRGGMLSMLVALGFTVLVFARNRGLRAGGWLVTGFAVLAFLALLYAGIDAVFDRLASLNGPDPSAGRTQIYKDIAVAWKKFPVAGLGLGTHKVVYPMFDRSVNAALAEYADSDYAQMAEEVGAAGLAIIVVFLVMMGVNYARAIRASRPLICAAAFGLGYGLLAVMIHGATDYGQHLPSIAALSAISCGLLVTLGRKARQQQVVKARTAADAGASVPSVSPSRWRPLRLTAAAAMTAAMAWALLYTNDARRAEAYASLAFDDAAALEQDNWEGSNAAYAELLSDAAAAAAIAPDNVEYRYWLNVYRWRSMGRTKDTESGQPVIIPDRPAVARRIADELHHARAVCPTYGPAYCVAGQIEQFVLGEPDGARHIQTGYGLAPNHPVACLAAGTSDAVAGRWDDSLQKLRKAIVLDPGLSHSVIKLYARQLNRPDLALAAVKDTPELIIALITDLDKQAAVSKGANPRAAEVRATAVAMLKSEAERPDTKPGVLAWLGSMHDQAKEYPAAIQCYRWAIGLNYGVAEWHLQLASALSHAGNRSEALHEAEVSLRLRPEISGAKALITELHNAAEQVSVETLPSAGANVR